MVKVNCETKLGGAVTLNERHGVWASYAVATAGDLPPAELLYVGAKLDDGRRVQIFLNRETNLLVVDIVNNGGKSGTEIVRRIV